MYNSYQFKRMCSLFIFITNTPISINFSLDLYYAYGVLYVIFPVVLLSVYKSTVWSCMPSIQDETHPSKKYKQNFLSWVAEHIVLMIESVIDSSDNKL